PRAASSGHVATPRPAGAGTVATIQRAEREPYPRREDAHHGHDREDEGPATPLVRDRRGGGRGVLLLDLPRFPHRPGDHAPERDAERAGRLREGRRIHAPRPTVPGHHGRAAPRVQRRHLPRRPLRRPGRAGPLLERAPRGWRQAPAVRLDHRSVGASLADRPRPHGRLAERRRPGPCGPRRRCDAEDGQARLRGARGGLPRVSGGAGRWARGRRWREATRPLEELVRAAVTLYRIGAAHDGNRLPDVHGESPAGCTWVRTLPRTGGPNPPLTPKR